MAESGIADDANYFLGSHLGFIANSGEIVLNPTHFYVPLNMISVLKVLLLMRGRARA